MTNQTQNPDNLQDPDGSAKRTYVKPEFRYEQVFETMALACGKISSTQASCSGFNQSAS
jgi:hypothetical protein